VGTCHLFLTNQHNARQPRLEVGELNQFIFFSFEVAIGPTSTSLRILINGDSAATLDLPFKIDPAKVEPTGGVIGADLEGNNGARFDLESWALYTATLTSDELQQLAQYFSSKSHTKYAQFSGTQWMRAQPNRSFQQDDPAAKPIYRDLTAPK
jgi:hypothetical protein